jgi:hypothetical protein
MVVMLNGIGDFSSCHYLGGHCAQMLVQKQIFGIYVALVPEATAKKIPDSR